MQTAMAFLSTRVGEPDEDDWRKLVRSTEHPRGTKESVLTPSADDSNALKWHVDASHPVHDDLKGCTGGNFSVGKGTICSESAKQKLNTRSSTETESVGADDCMPQVLWTNHFIGAQGHTTNGTMTPRQPELRVIGKQWNCVKWQKN